MQLESEKLNSQTLKHQLEIERGYSARLTDRQALSISTVAAGSVPGAVGPGGGVGVGGAGGVVAGVGGLGQVRARTAALLSNLQKKIHQLNLNKRTKL